MANPVIFDNDITLERAHSENKRLFAARWRGPSSGLYPPGVYRVAYRAVGGHAWTVPPQG